MSAGERARRFLGVPLIDDLGELSGRSVLVRADFDLGRYEPGSAAHQRRLEVLVPTLRHLVEAGAAPTVCGHAGDFDSGPDETAFARAREAIERACPGTAVQENLTGEAERLALPELVDELVKGHDLYVNEAFQWCWLPLASIIGPPTRLPGAAGLRLGRDLELLEPFLVRPPRPFVVAFGSDQSLSRLPGLRGLILRADAILVGGAMALPFLQAIGVRPAPVPETALLRECRSCFGLSREILHEVDLPSDLVWERPDGTTELAPAGQLVEGSVSDIGPATRLRFGEVLRGAGSVLWTGALGRAEDPRFAAGTREVAMALPPSAHVVIGGDGLLSALGADTLGSVTGVLSATDSAIALLKDGDLPGLAALRHSPG